ncbi:hypothetical protein T484DRAFT_1790545, partial [Baffinella frigidus]
MDARRDDGDLIDALREDGDLLRSQMEESGVQLQGDVLRAQMEEFGVQLQVAHARIFTPERCVRESDSNMASVAHAHILTLERRVRESDSGMASVAHARILTLERRVRESDSDMASVKRDLETCAGEAERAEALQLRVLSLEEEVRRNLQVASLLEDKEMLLSDA